MSNSNGSVSVMNNNGSGNNMNMIVGNNNNASMSNNMIITEENLTTFNSFSMGIRSEVKVISKDDDYVVNHDNDTEVIDNNHN